VHNLFYVIKIIGHSGRTDSNGGHRDNNNVSGLGNYHYHHGKPPHLHPGGVCPYDRNNNEGNKTRFNFITFILIGDCEMKRF